MNNPRILNNRRGSRLAALAVVVLAATSALPMSSTTQVAWRDKPVPAQPDWPEGVLDLVNDPLRTEGWNPWFSECPNDVNFYAFQVSVTNEVNRLIAKLAAIKSQKAQVFLYPDEEARALAFTTVLDEGNGAAVVFSIGSQERMNQWYQHLREEEPGVRIFGVHRYHEPPTAQPPTLTLHVGNKAVDLKSLKIPTSVEVTAVVSASDRAAGKNASLIKAIDDFVAQHRAKPSKPAEEKSKPITK
jgi:hypothetical protein